MTESEDYMSKKAKLTLNEQSKAYLAENSDLKNKWIAGLRSGKYPQITGAMVDPRLPGSCCCLMVAEIECNNRDWNEAFSETDCDYVDVAVTPEDFQDGLKKLGKLEAIYEVPFKFKAKGESWRPAEWNDHLKLTFNQIADLLERGEVEYEVPRDPY